MNYFRARIILILLVLTGVAIAAYNNFMNTGATSPATDKITTTTSVAQVIELGSKTTANLITGKFNLIDQDGHKKTQHDFRGRLTLVYFGYCYCPDICPQALDNITSALQLMGDKSKDINVVFISVDPERDRVSDIKRYLTNYSPRITGLTGTQTQIADAAQSFRAYFAKVDDTVINAANVPNAAQHSTHQQPKTDYLIDHSSIIYVMDKRGRYLTSFNHQTSPQEMSLSLLKLL